MTTRFTEKPEPIAAAQLANEHDAVALAMALFVRLDDLQRHSEADAVGRLLIEAGLVPVTSRQSRAAHSVPKSRADRYQRSRSYSEVIEFDEATIGDEHNSLTLSVALIARLRADGYPELANSVASALGTDDCKDTTNQTEPLSQTTSDQNAPIIGASLDAKQISNDQLEEAALGSALAVRLTTVSEQDRPSLDGSEVPRNDSIELGKELDRGAFGTVYEAKDLLLGRRVAVKIVRASGEAVSSALDHAKALARTSHPNVVSVHSLIRIMDPETKSWRDAIVMELVEGPKLSERLAGPLLSSEEASTVGHGIIDGLDHIHKQGLTHEDLHENNVMLVGLRPKLIDIMYRTTLADLTTSSREGRIRRDLNNLKELLSDLIARSQISAAQRERFDTSTGRNASIDEIRASFVQVFGSSGADAGRAIADVPTGSASQADNDVRRDDAVDRPPAGRIALHRGRRSVWALSISILLGGAIWIYSVTFRSQAIVPSPVSSLSAAAPVPIPTPSQAQAPTTATTVVESAPSAAISAEQSDASCSLPTFEQGAARRYVATASSEAGAELLRSRLARMVAQEPNGPVWTTAILKYPQRADRKGKWIIIVDLMSPGVAKKWCRWLIDCKGWTETCTDKPPPP